ncbi:MAG: glycosyltransferase family 4 protein [Candidatus Roizmanbacteria bacterium]
MKKIALLHFAYPPNIGGVEIMVKEHVEILTNLGYDVTVVTGSGEETDRRIKMVVIPELQSVSSFNPFLQEKILDKGIIDDEFYKLAAIIDQGLEKTLEKIDIIVIHNMITIVRNLPFVHAFKNFVKKYPKKKYFGWTHDHSYINEFQIKDLSKIVNSKLEKELLTTPIKNLTYILISESFREPFVRLMGLHDGETVVIPNGIDIKYFLEIDDLIWEIIDKYQLLKKFPLILSPVNILERKNIDYCFDIIYALKKTYPKISYIITGKPSSHRSTLEYYDRLKKKIDDLGLKDNVMFFNDFLNRALMRSEIHDLYQIADMVFFLSKSENFGLPLLEAALTKTAILVSDLKVFREVGGEFVKYLDYKTVSAEKAAELVKNFIEQSLRVKLNYRSRTQYDLKTILKEKFIPLL